MAFVLLAIIHGMVRLALAVLIAILSSGCAALPLGAVGAAAVSGGASSAMKAGTESTFGGKVSRTFSASLDDMHDAALATMQRLGIKVAEEDRTEHGTTILYGEAYGRRVKAEVDPVTPQLTRMSFTVRSGLSRDTATAAELLLQTEKTLERRATGQASPR